MDGAAYAHPDQGEKLVIGIDPSLSATAVCPYLVGGSQPEVTLHKASKPDNTLFGRVERLTDLARRVVDQVEDDAKESGAFLAGIGIEGYSYGSKGASVITLGEYGVLLRRGLMMRFPHLCKPHRMWEIAPSKLKKFCAGSGIAKKLQVALSLAKRYGVHYETDDEFDAYGLARMVACMVGAEEPEVKFQREALCPVAKKPKPRKSRKKVEVQQELPMTEEPPF